ncbi:MAG: hypothetical protein JWQ27_415 [Ferruginibacter sp.]|nr:hypothetical protein [Ferruginibacter sp.]
MKTKIFIAAVGLFFTTALTAQTQFINKASIEYEVKTNIKKTMGTGMWEEMMKDVMPDFKVSFYKYSFANDKSIYKFDHWENKAKFPEYMRRNEEDNVWYFDHTTGKMNMQKGIWGTYFNIEDSIIPIEWKLENENRVIAGFNCRKAVGKIMDSVYVFAFYTDEIMIPGGPCSVSGLPGMILGLTIPRLYTSWIATKVSLTDVDEKAIKPITAKKYYTNNTLKTTLDERKKEWVREDDPNDQKWMEQLMWNTRL